MPVASRARPWALFAVFACCVCYSAFAQTDLLDLPEEGPSWRFNKGWEFPGAKGTLTFSDEGFEGYRSLLLEGDFTGGGAYLATDLNVSSLQADGRITVFEIEYKTESANRLTVRVGDETGQTHQRKLYIESDGEWHRLLIVPELQAGGEHWGGANDGRWHGDVRYLSFILPSYAWPDKKPSFRISRILAYTGDELAVSRMGARQAFEAPLAEQGWDLEGSAALDEAEVLEGGQSLKLSRGENQSNQTFHAKSPWFEAAAGRWFVSFARKTALSSPDNSYRLAGRLLFADKEGNTLGSEELLSLYGAHEWDRLVALVDAPSGTKQLRFEAVVEKAWGEAWLDDLTLALVDPEPEEKVVSRIELSSEALGNLFYPEDELRFDYVVRTSRVLAADESRLVYVPRSFRGAALQGVVGLDLDNPSRQGDAYLYQGSLTLAADRLERGRYHSLDLVVYEGEEVLARDSYGFARLDEAPNNALAHEAVPFTVRNWDSRIADYLRLSRRLGIRVANLWGGWSKSAPYKPWLGAIDLTESLDLKWIMIAASKRLEQGDSDWNATNLYEGTQAFLQQYADRGLYAISLGNEPHGDRAKIADYMVGYRAVYQAVKDFDPDIEVIASSSGPDENHWLEGIGDYSDSYDFHSYESYKGFPGIFARYRDLMTRYDAEKPIRSTEIGLNSQGLPRFAVASDMAKKVSTFFAEGGATVGWFSILYPDPEGVSQGSFGQAHNMFASQYNRYNTKLDGIAYYHLINAVADKGFVEARTEADGTVLHRYENAAGEGLLVLWNELGESSVRLPFAEGVSVKTIHVDGQARQMESGENGIGLTARWEPLLVLYDGALSLEDAEVGVGHRLAIETVSAPHSVQRGEVARFELVFDASSIGELWIESDEASALAVAVEQNGRAAVSVDLDESSISDRVRAAVVGYDLEGRAVAERVIEFDVEGPVPELKVTVTPSAPSGLSLQGSL